jgi:hypothetical protein
MNAATFQISPPQSLPGAQKPLHSGEHQDERTMTREDEAMTATKRVMTAFLMGKSLTPKLKERLIFQGLRTRLIR